MTWFLIALGIAVALIVGGAAALRVAAARAPVPELGIVDGRLQACPETSNCVSSQAHPYDADHYLPPVPFDGDPDRVAAAVDDVVLKRPRTERVERAGRYLRYASQTYLMGFTDDMEFWIDDARGEVHFRSASRKGRDDLGTNRTRMRSIVDELEDRLEDDGLAPIEAPPER